MAFTGPANAPQTVNDALDEVLGRLTHARERVESAVYRITRLADRMVGPEAVPIGPEKIQPRVVQSSIEGMTSDILGELDRLFTQLDRLNR